MAIRTETAIRRLIEMDFPAFHRGHDDRAVVRVSAEDPRSDGTMGADYWHPSEPGWIHPALMAWADENDLFFEWENPSNIAAYRC